jgi:two-component system OmpR family sensor kinase
MDGLQRRVGRSLQVSLSLWLAIAILATAIVAAVAAFSTAYREAIDLQDDQLQQLAVMVSGYDLPSAGYTFAGNTRKIDPETQIVVEQLPLSGGHALKQGPLAGLASGLPDGLHSVRPARLSWRIAVATTPSGAQIAVGQRTAVRGEIARNTALNALLPILLLIPVLLLVCNLLVRAAFTPLKLLATELDERAENDMRGIVDVDLPRELRPFVVAINRLLERVAQAVMLQRRFVADAAHELRSPLAALSLQAERLEAADMSEQARERLVTLRQGMTRNQTLVTQLLALARAHDRPTEPLKALSAQGLFRAVLEDMWPLADAKHIDIGVAGTQDVILLAAPDDLTTLIKNLVENAIGYTPEHGRVDLAASTDAGDVTLTICDTGPGIAAQDRERVFEPFYRVPGAAAGGSGLGLSIVKTIADRMQARIRLGYTDEANQSGLTVQVVLPGAARPMSFFKQQQGG